MKKKSAKTEQTKQNLKDAFWQIYAEKDLSEITVKEITDKAGLNRGTFYAYFQDLPDILQQIEDEFIDRFVERLSSAMTAFEGMNPIDSNEELLLDLYRDHNSPTGILIWKRANYRFILKVKSALKTVFQKYLPENIINHPDYEYVIEYLMAGQLAMISLWMKKGQDKTPEEMIALSKAMIRESGMQYLYQR